MAASGATNQVHHERARRAVFGWIGPAILHETNNVLTVMSGVRQLLRSGMGLSDRIGGMIDQQLLRMEELVAWLRRLSPEDGEAGGAARTAAFVLESVERIVQLAGKGRGVTIERVQAAEPWVVQDPEAAGLALLCVLLPELPARGGSGMTIRLAAAASSRSAVEFSVACRSAAAADPGEPERERAEALLAVVGGTLKRTVTATEWQARITLPLAARS